MNACGERTARPELLLGVRMRRERYVRLGSRDVEEVRLDRGYMTPPPPVP
jgi:hypothetical protein